LKQNFLILFLEFEKRIFTNKKSENQNKNPKFKISVAIYIKGNFAPNNFIKRGQI